MILVNIIIILCVCVYSGWGDRIQEGCNIPPLIFSKMKWWNDDNQCIQKKFNFLILFIPALILLAFINYKL